MQSLLKNLLIVIALISFAKAQGQEIGKWRWAEDKWYTDDKLTHCLGSAWLCEHFKKRIGWKAILLTLGLGVLWEVKDGFLPCEQIGWFGGDGFSYRDLTADVAGIILNVVFNGVTNEKNLVFSSTNIGGM